MQKTDIIPLLIRFLTNEHLSEKERQELDRWLEEDPSNSALLEEFRDVKNIKADLNVLSDIDVEKEWRNISPRLQIKSSPNMFWRWSLAIASVLVVVFFTIRQFDANQIQEQDVVVKSGTDSVQGYDIPPAGNDAHVVLSDGTIVDITKGENIYDKIQHIALTPESQVPSLVDQGYPDQEIVYHTLVVPKGSSFQITLSDGTKVWINAMSKLKFPAQMGHEERRVHLDGEAYFDVAHDKGRPFVVENKGADIKVLGTEFNINTYSSVAKTTLVKGSVELINATGHNVILSPGQRADYHEGEIRVRTANVAKDIAWKRGEFYFYNETIGQILNEISRWYNLDVKLVGKISLDKQYSGSISRQVQLSEVLEMLKYAGKLRFEVNGKELVVKN